MINEYSIYLLFLTELEKDVDYAEGAKAYLTGQQLLSPYAGKEEMWGASHAAWLRGYVTASTVHDFIYNRNGEYFYAKRNDPRTENSAPF